MTIPRRPVQGCAFLRSRSNVRSMRPANCFSVHEKKPQRKKTNDGTKTRRYCASAKRTAEYANSLFVCSKICTKEGYGWRLGKLGVWNNLVQNQHINIYNLHEFNKINTYLPLLAQLISSMVGTWLPSCSKQSISETMPFAQCRKQCIWNLYRFCLCVYCIGHIAL